LLVWAFEKGMVPILADVNVFENLRENVLRNSSYSPLKLQEFLKNNLRKRKGLLEKGACIQLKQPFDELEEAVHNRLSRMGLNPEGKKLLETRYGTFTVPDNYFKKEGKEVVVFVSKADLWGVVGSAALVKEMISPKVETIGIVLNSNKSRFKSKALNTLLKTYVDYFYNSPEEVENKYMGP